RVRYLLMSRSTSTCLCIVVESAIAPATLRLLASSTNDAITGAWATSSAPPRSSSKYALHSGLTLSGFTRYRSYSSSMNGALLPNSVLLSRNSVMLPMASPRQMGAAPRPCNGGGDAKAALALVQRRNRALLGAHEELPWPADLVLRIGNHLVQLRD